MSLLKAVHERVQLASENVFSTIENTDYFYGGGSEKLLHWLTLRDDISRVTLIFGVVGRT